MCVSATWIYDESKCNLPEQMKARKLLCLKFTTVPTKFVKKFWKTGLHWQELLSIEVRHE